MKYFLLFIFLSFYSCAQQEIQMRQMPLKLTGVKKAQNDYGQSLTLNWQSLDGRISIVTEAPVRDSAQYIVGVVYARCFIRR